MLPRTAMAPSGPCGSDRLDTSSTSSGSAPGLIAMQYRSQSRVNQPRKLARRLLHKWLKRKQWALCSDPGGRSGLREKPHGESDTDHQQQEVFVVVAARLAADEILRAGVRRNHYRAGRCFGESRKPAAVVLDTGAMSTA